MQYQQAKKYINDRMRKELPKSLAYHSVAHVKDVCQAAERLAKAEGVTGEDLALLMTAVMYHDCGFMVQNNEHEQIGCDIARESLPGFDYTPEQIERICGMIMATRIPQTPRNLLEEIIADADLDYLGRDDFWAIGNKLFAELQMYGIISTEEEWNALQVKFLEQHHYFTATAIRTRKQKKDEYVAILKNGAANMQPDSKKS
jgi:predicted metal-dependent HD superfamily phosphohydrolase